jgi:hypothetical protein
VGRLDSALRLNLVDGLENMQGLCVAVFE